jgi:hypothetical protein
LQEDGAEQSIAQKARTAGDSEAARSESDAALPHPPAEQTGSLDDAASLERASRAVVSQESAAVSAESGEGTPPRDPAVAAGVHEPAIGGGSEERAPQPQAEAAAPINPEDGTSTEHHEPAAVTASPVDSDASPPDESADDEAARRSHHSSESRPEVTT